MKKLTIFIFFNLINLINLQMSQAQVIQEWVHRIVTNPQEENKMRGMAIDNSGNIIVTGEKGVGTYMTVTTKMNQNGDTLWRRFFQTPGYGYDSPRGIATDPDGNIIVVGNGFVGNVNSGDNTIIKYKPNGDTLWIKRWNSPFSSNDLIERVRIDNDGYIYANGYSHTTGSNFDTYTFKYSPSGDLLWEHRFDAPSHLIEYPTAMEIDNSGNTFVTCYSQNTGTSLDIFTYKLNSNGVEQWVNRYNGTLNKSDYSYCMKINQDGSIIVGGGTEKSSTDHDLLLIKITAAGDTVWTKKFDSGCNKAEGARDMVIDNSGNICVTGYSSNCTSTGEDIMTFKFNSSGDMIWSARYNGAGNNTDYGDDINVDSEGNVYVTGRSSEIFAYTDFVTIKYNSSGFQKWLKTYNGPLNGNDYGEIMILDNEGCVFVAGTSETPSAGFQATVIKYSQKTVQLIALIEGLYNNVSDLMIKDTVTVFLRNTTSPFAVVDSVKSVLDSAGKGAFTFKNTTTGTSYYIVIKHRNSIETWSSSGQSFTSNTINYDFTTAANKAYGDNLVQKGSKFCIYSGDVTQGGSVDLTDLSQIDNDAFNFVSGYVATDLNGDGYVDLADYTIADNNAFNYVIAVNPSQQGPMNFRSPNDKINSEKKSIILKDNFPNPFNPNTVISYQLTVSSFITLKVYDALGKEVVTLVNKTMNAGEHSVTFNASGLSSGMYFYKLKANGFEQVKRMMLVK